MDREGVDQACLMAVENPEECDFYFTNEQVLAASQRYPDPPDPLLQRRSTPPLSRKLRALPAHRRIRAARLPRVWRGAGRRAGRPSRACKRSMPPAENWASPSSSTRITTSCETRPATLPWSACCKPTPTRCLSAMPPVSGPKSRRMPSSTRSPGAVSHRSCHAHRAY
jgi:hypothetical protein